MDWYKRYLRKQAVQGEWWIEEGGNARYCDAGIGEWGHEGYVMDLIMSKYYDGNTEMYDGGTPTDWFYSLSDKEISDLGITQEEAEVLTGGDAREYAIKHLGWKRMAGSYIDTWTLTSNDLREIIEGIWDAYDERAEDEEFTIYVYSNKKIYWNVPFEVIESKNPIKLVNYQER